MHEVENYSGVINAVIGASSAAIVVYLLRNFATGSPQFSFMAWNLVLSLLALLAACAAVLSYKSKNKALTILFSVAWLFLLPNTFYMLTDFVHVKDSGDINYLFDIVLVGFFAMNGFVHGLLSLLIMHKLFLKKYDKTAVTIGIGLVILASSFAVDMGRYLRWNSWDVLTRPAALIFDISDAALNPFSYDRSFLITGVFFVTIASLYSVVYSLSKLQWGKHA